MTGLQPLDLRIYLALNLMYSTSPQTTWSNAESYADVVGIAGHSMVRSYWCCVMQYL